MPFFSLSSDIQPSGWLFPAPDRVSHPRQKDSTSDLAAKAVMVYENFWSLLCSIHRCAFIKMDFGQDFWTTHCCYTDVISVLPTQGTLNPLSAPVKSIRWAFEGLRDWISITIGFNLSTYPEGIVSSCNWFYKTVWVNARWSCLYVKGRTINKRTFQHFYDLLRANWILCGQPLHLNVEHWMYIHLQR